MEAKDTVMDIAEDKYDGLGADTLVELQAEISFKAGIKEVAEWIDEWWERGRGGKQNWYELEAKLKEWGISTNHIK